MAADFVNRAGRDINIGAQISNPRGPVRVVAGGDLHEASADYGSELLSLIDELRHAITVAQQRAELSSEAGAYAQYELEIAAEEVEATISGDSSGLVASLKRLRPLLAGAVDLLAKVAAIASAVQGFR
jgi:hypothetical protein